MGLHHTAALALLATSLHDKELYPQKLLPLDEAHGELVRHVPQPPEVAACGCATELLEALRAAEGETRMKFMIGSSMRERASKHRPYCSLTHST